MFIPPKGTRRGLASWGKALVQLAALPGFIEQQEEDDGGVRGLSFTLLIPLYLFIGAKSKVMGNYPVTS